MRRLQDVFNLLLARLELQIGKIFIAVLAHVGINHGLPLSFVVELARNLFVGKKFVVIVNRLEHLPRRVSNRRMINNARRLAADNANIGRARANVNANCALREVAALAVEFVEVISRRFTLGVEGIRSQGSGVRDCLATNFLEGNFLRLRKSRRVGEIPLNVVDAV